MADVHGKNYFCEVSGVIHKLSYNGVSRTLNIHYRFTPKKNMHPLGCCSFSAHTFRYSCCFIKYHNANFRKFTNKY